MPFTQMSLAKHLLAAIALSAAFASSAGPREDARLSNATRVLNEMQSSADQNVPQWLLERAYAVVIVPDVIKVGLGVGGRRGSGVLVLRQNDGTWSNPVFVNLTGGSFGLQVGVQTADVLLVFTSRAGVDGIVGGKVTLGADAAVAAGPVGRQTQAGTDVGLNTQVYSYARTKGLFAGLALDGSAVTIAHRSNADYYGRPGVLASEIVAANAPQAPDSAREFTAALDRILGVSSQASYAPSSNTTNPSPTNSGATRPISPPSSQNAEPGQLTTHPMEDPNPGAEPPN